MKILSKIETLKTQLRTLENGIRIITKENHSTPIVSFCAFFAGGVRAEKKEFSGISHFTQRMLLKGTKTKSAEEIARRIEYMGATFTPFTAKDTFGCSMNVLAKHFDEGLEIFADCILNPAFSAGEVEKERKNILLEIARKKDESFSCCLELCEEALFDGHPYGFPVMGKEKSISSIKKGELVKWHEELYHPSRMVIALVGDLKRREVEKKIIEKFYSLPKPEKKVKFLPPPPPLKKARILNETSEKRQVVFSLGFQAPSVNDKDYFAFDVLTHVLAGMGSRLFIELRDKKGLAYSVSASYDARADVGVFKSFIGTSVEQKDKAHEAMLAELEKIRRKKVPADELERAKKYMLGLYEISLQKNQSQACRYAYMELLGGGYEILERYPLRIKEVTSEEVLEAARKYIDTQNFAKAILMPAGIF
ncbi:MAG: insulinase family protein [Firmicutes bacterium]|nr:insulinase family protein [Bacillota bacterium]